MLGIMLAAVLIAIPVGMALLGGFETITPQRITEVDDTEDDDQGCEDADEEEPPTTEPPIYASPGGDLAFLAILPKSKSSAGRRHHVPP